MRSRIVPNDFPFWLAAGMRHCDAPTRRQAAFSQAVESDHLPVYRCLNQQQNRNALPHMISLESSVHYEHEDFLSAATKACSRIPQVDRPYWYSKHANP